MTLESGQGGIGRDQLINKSCRIIGDFHLLSKFNNLRIRRIHTDVCAVDDDCILRQIRNGDRFTGNRIGPHQTKSIRRTYGLEYRSIDPDGVVNKILELTSARHKQQRLIVTGHPDTLIEVSIGVHISRYSRGKFGRIDSYASFSDI